MFNRGDVTPSVQIVFNRMAALSMLALLWLGAVQGQTPPVYTPATHGWTPLAQQPGAPAGSYPLSGFDNVNLFNGDLNFRLPLMQIGGRGRAGYTLMLPIEQHWQVQTVAVPTCDQSGCTYDSYANLAQVILPTGGRIEYDWITDDYEFGDHVFGIYSRVLERRTAVDTVTSVYETKTTYSMPSGGVVTVANLFRGPYTSSTAPAANSGLVL